ncbi:hypothetical protein I6H42_00040 [Schaalia meyeri]|uniref:Lipoprotein n=1 Tax=Schaalia meyeri TaxID=52773 RepID=A0AAP9Y8S2_9ACTO|nr:hypothetical protein [Schaalia meyeri]QQC43788.1 hypothetical protein I6H42_08490 [Schaalia meyeri]QQC43876.1 hypothetical protein I6H42_00040 [Schaalia meyeri]SDR71401.1 hypothetical protein SAMN04489715_0857 [Schaalia meyeri]SDR76017.1 hypothetical protein SAMN04489715_0984 [Schaalia meyeri]
MLSLVSRRVVAAASSFLFVVVGLSGCFPFRGGSADISKLQNIPEGQKRELIAQMSSASGQEKRRIGEKAVALSKMVGAQLVGVDPAGISGQQFKLDAQNRVSVNKDDMVYKMMSATDFWRLGGDSYDLCVEQDCEYYSSWTVDVEGSGGDVVYVWTLKIDGADQPDKPLVRRFKVAK